MAWNPSPQVSVARKFADKFNKKMVVIVHIDDHGELGYASYGETKFLCGYARKLGDVAFDAIMKHFQNES